jgi:hypothetical protein
VLTVVDGKIVHGSGPFRELAPELPPASPSWSPVTTYGGYPSALPELGSVPACGCIAF